MSFDSEWALAGCMKGGASGSGYPAGWLSEKKPCPECGRPVAGRQVGMTEHMRAKHGTPLRSAREASAEAWKAPS